MPVKKLIDHRSIWQSVQAHLHCLPHANHLHVYIGVRSLKRRTNTKNILQEELGPMGGDDGLPSKGASQSWLAPIIDSKDRIRGRGTWQVCGPVNGSRAFATPHSPTFQRGEQHPQGPSLSTAFHNQLAAYFQPMQERQPRIRLLAAHQWPCSLHGQGCCGSSCRSLWIDRCSQNFSREPQFGQS